MLLLPLLASNYCQDTMRSTHSHHGIAPTRPPQYARPGTSRLAHAPAPRSAPDSCTGCATADTLESDRPHSNLKVAPSPRTPLWRSYRHSNDAHTRSRRRLHPAKHTPRPTREILTDGRHGAERACKAGDDRRAHGPRGGAPTRGVVRRREGRVAPVPGVGVQVGPGGGVARHVIGCHSIHKTRVCISVNDVANNLSPALRFGGRCERPSAGTWGRSTAWPGRTRRARAWWLTSRQRRCGSRRRRRAGTWRRRRTRRKRTTRATAWRPQGLTLVRCSSWEMNVRCKSIQFSLHGALVF